MDKGHPRIKSVRSSRGKPLGGFVFIRVRSILGVWHALTTGHIDTFAVRVWIAAQEVKARRCRAGDDTKPQYLLNELLGLLGTGRKCQLKKAIERLVEAGLLSWATDDVSVCTTSFEETVDNCPEWHELLACVANNRRKVPVPRRIIRCMAKTRSRTIIGTTFGSLLRGLYYRDSKCVSGGRVKCSWIAETFDLDLRNVKKARSQLVEIGWLLPGEAPQTSLNRWGLPVEINLLWGLRVVQSSTETPPRNAESEQESPPPYINRELSSRSSFNQEPDAAGVETRTTGRVKPCLGNITVEDLHDPGRLDRLYDEATAAGLMPRTVSARLKWFAAAERAIQAGQSNPCGFFVAMYRRGLWHHITQEQEDLARVKLKRLDFGEDSRLAGMGQEFVPDCRERAA